MAYKHGIYVSEVPTAVVPPVNTEGCLPVVFGTAPLHLASDRAKANRPVLCYTYAEAVAAFGYSTDWESYSLCEAIYSQFALFGVAPVVFVNVLDPAVHKTAVVEQSIDIDDGMIKITDSALLDTLHIKVNSDNKDLIEGTDYEAAYDDDENLIITILPGGALKTAVGCYVGYDRLDASKVTEADIIGGVSISTGEVQGLETLKNVYPLYGIVPGMVVAPGWSDKPEVAAVMKAKASTINGLFKAVVLTDIPSDTDGVTKYTDASAWKNDNNYVGVDQAACWPMVTLGDRKYHMSTQLMGVMGTVNASNDDIPFESPSNKNMQADGLCLADGSEVIMDLEQANYLNGQGIITGLNFNGGWKVWGNRTACYPSNTDVKDAFLSERCMFNWHRQTFILTYWNKLDKPTNKRLIDTIIDSENIRLNGLTAGGYILGGRIEFQRDENPDTNLLDGIICFHTYLAPDVPAREIDNKLEFDTSYFDTLFA